MNKPHYPKTRYYKKRGGRRPWYTQRYSAMQIAGKALKTVNYLRGMINCEKKMFGTTAVSTQDTTAGEISHWSAIDTGDGYNERNGNSILAKTLYVQCMAQIHASATLTSARHIIFIDTESNGTIPATTDVLEDVSGSGGVIQPLQHDAQGRFLILFDRRMVLDNDTKKLLQYHKFIKLPKNLHIKYSGADGGTSYEKNQIFSLTISSESTNAPTITCNFRLAYYDN